MASVSATTSSNSLDERFATLRAAGRKALVCYITAGHPDRASTIALMRGLERAGADVLEVGVPFSDPLADGTVIQASSQAALDGGMTLSGVLDVIAEASVSIPVVLFGYLNPFLAAGESLGPRLRDAGCAGVLVTDLPVGADPVLEERFAQSGLDFIRLVAPTTPPARIREIARHGSGFVYLISRLGVTGTRDELPADLAETIARVRAETSLPVCVGFGVSTPEHAARVARLADGVVVGSALVRAAGESVDRALELAAALRRGIDER
jgi:tryptophan synthase alpha chain